ncbi:MAG TPA: hypothetical protein VIN08_25130 [Ohtaekwangia sp.]|uniref:hypothetical protein n=1 Tax=Ohtaekwangia sp. TaxID=2066019 RepID=UPI002F9368C5
MRRILAMIVLLAVTLVACHNDRPAYRTSSGKKKLKHYNKLQYGERKTFNQ